jgi:hypothetical protein
MTLLIIGSLLIVAGGIASVLTPPTTIAFPLTLSGIILIIVWFFK